MKLFTFILIISICIFTITSRVHVKKNKNLNNKKINKVDIGGYDKLYLQLKWKEGTQKYNTSGWSLNIPFDFKPVEGLLFSKKKENLCSNSEQQSSIYKNFLMNNTSNTRAIIPWRKINKCEWKFNGKYPYEMLELSDDKKGPNPNEYKGQFLKFYNYYKTFSSSVALYQTNDGNNFCNKVMIMANAEKKEVTKYKELILSAVDKYASYCNSERLMNIKELKDEEQEKIFKEKIKNIKDNIDKEKKLKESEEKKLESLKNTADEKNKESNKIDNEYEPVAAKVSDLEKALKDANIENEKTKQNYEKQKKLVKRDKKLYCNMKKMPKVQKEKLENTKDALKEEKFKLKNLLESKKENDEKSLKISNELTEARNKLKELKPKKDKADDENEKAELDLKQQSQKIAGLDEEINGLISSKKVEKKQLKDLQAKKVEDYEKLINSELDNFNTNMRKLPTLSRGITGYRNSANNNFAKLRSKCKKDVISDPDKDEVTKYIRYIFSG